MCLQTGVTKSHDAELGGQAQQCTLGQQGVAGYHTCIILAESFDLMHDALCCEQTDLASKQASN